MFNDNSKYLFIHISESHPDIDVCWLSPNRETVREIRRIGLNALYVMSIKGLLFALRSGYWIVNSYTSDVMFCLSGRATVINLWHGLGLKRIEFNIDSGPLVDRYVKRTLKEHITHPESYRRPEFLLTVSEHQTKVLSTAFRLPYSQCLRFGYPRNAIQLWSEPLRQDFIGRYEGPGVQNLICELADFNKIFIYMPTWRDSQRDIFVQNFDLDRMDSLMKKQNSLLLLKPHANTLIEKDVVKGLSNVRLIDGIVDIYPVLAYCDVLITDYSSILYDYLLMKGKSVILYLYDYKDYQSSRDFIYPFHENVTGTEVFSFDELVRIIDAGDYDINSSRRDEIVSRIWGGTDMERASEDIYYFIDSLSE